MFPQGFYDTLRETARSERVQEKELEEALEDIQRYLDKYSMGGLIGTKSAPLSKAQQNELFKEGSMIAALIATIIFFARTSKSYEKAGLETLRRLNDKTARVKELEAIVGSGIK